MNLNGWVEKGWRKSRHRDPMKNQGRGNGEIGGSDAMSDWDREETGKGEVGVEKLQWLFKIEDGVGENVRVYLLCGCENQKGRGWGG